MSIYPVFVLRQNLGEVETIAFRETEPTLISGDSQGWLTIWNLDRRRPVSSFQPTNASDGILKVDWIGKHYDEVLVQSRGGIVQVWNADCLNDDPMISFSIDYEGFCKAEVIDESLVALPSSIASNAEVWNIKTPQSKTQVLSPSDLSKYGSCSAIASCGKEKNNVLIGYESGFVFQWDLRQTTQPLRENSCASSPITSISVDNEGKCAIIGSCDKLFYGMKLQSPGNVRKVEVPEEGIASIDIRTDCLLFGTGGWDSKIRLWNYRTLKPLAVLKYHSQEVTTLSFSKGKKQELATGSRDGTIAVWNVYSK